MKPRTGILRYLVLALALLAADCAYPTRNQQVKVIDNDSGYRWHKLAPNEPDDTLVIVTASGGGTRATALTLSVLRGLNAIALPSGKTLAERIDVISSVSGGSVAAGYFALKGRDGFKTLEEDFIRKDGMAALLAAGLNPIGLARLATPGTERIDLEINYFNKQLFHHTTYQTLIDQRRRPYLVLNAADMVEGVPFPFTQRQMSLLCSDLSQMPLATAVAASAAFPVALSPVTLKNYAPCADVPRRMPWPPAWVTNSLDEPGDEPSLWYDNPRRTMQARVNNAYLLGNDPRLPHRKLFIHLLDGGIADNLGIAEPFNMLVTDNTQPSFLRLIDTGKIRKLVFIVINARSFKASRLDERQATPGMLDMLLASIGAPIDQASAGSAAQLRNLLLSEFRQLMLGPTDKPDTKKQKLFRDLAANTALVSVDFDAIVDPECRRKYHAIPTSWTLKREQVDALLVVGKALLVNDPEFQRLLAITHGKPGPLPDLKQACAKL